MTAVRLSAGRDEALHRLENELGVLLRRIRSGLAERSAEVHPELGATAYFVLVTLVDQGPRRAADIACAFALDKGSVSRLVHHLVEMGLVEKSPDPQDGRAWILAATDDAVRRLEAARATRHREFGERLADWDDRALAGLAEGLSRFNSAMFDETGQ